MLLLYIDLYLTGRDIATSGLAADFQSGWVRLSNRSLSQSTHKTQDQCHYDITTITTTNHQCV